VNGNREEHHESDHLDHGLPYNKIHKGDCSEMVGDLLVRARLEHLARRASSVRATHSTRKVAKGKYIIETKKFRECKHRQQKISGPTNTTETARNVPSSPRAATLRDSKPQIITKNKNNHRIE